METVRWLDGHQQTTWRAYLDSTRLLFRALDRQLERDAGISLVDFEVLVALVEAPGRRLRMHELAVVVASTRSGVTRVVTRLAANGCVRRVRCEQDKRGRYAELTGAGAEKLCQAAPGHVATVRATMFDLLDEQQTAQLWHIASTLRAHLLDS